MVFFEGMVAFSSRLTLGMLNKSERPLKGHPFFDC
jgi:hypothetical protein